MWTRNAIPLVVIPALTLACSIGVSAQRRPYPPGYPMWIDDRTVSLRIDAAEKDAEVFVDGYLAGLVDDFDGVFQRLHVTPGEHDIAVYLPGYRTVHERRYFNPRASVTLRIDMVPLATGEPQEARPEPAPVDPNRPAPGRGEPPRREPPGAERRRPEPPVRMGTLALSIDPADAQIFIDDEPWSQRAEPQHVLSIQLAPGRHSVEVRKEGYRTYQQDVLIRPNATLRLEVGLRKS